MSARQQALAARQAARSTARLATAAEHRGDDATAAVLREQANSEASRSVGWFAAARTGAAS